MSISSSDESARPLTHPDKPSQAAAMHNSFQGLSARAFSERIPMNGLIELTRFCNLRCRHCYLSSHDRSCQDVMDWALYNKILDDLVDGSCVNVCLTGGEALAVKQFEDYYGAAANRGFITFVQTNGTLLSGRALDLFREIPPDHIGVSIYGSTPETFEGVTGVPGSYNAFRKGLDAIRSLGIGVQFRLTLMKHNLAELESIRKLVADYQGTLTTYFYLAPPGDDTGFDAEQSLEPEDVVRVEFEDPKLSNDFIRRLRGFSSGQFSTDDLFACPAGMSCYSITVDGMLHLCGHLWEYGFDLGKRSFSDYWQNEVLELRSRKRTRPLPGQEGGEYAFLSMQCPARSIAYSGDPEQPVPYLTRIFEARLREWQARGLDAVYRSGDGRDSA